MSCKIERPDPQTLWNRVSNDFSNTVLDGSDVIPESNEHYVVALNYAVQEQFFSLAESMWREKDPRTACCQNLYEMAALVGIYPLAATQAQGYIKITGEPDADIPNDIEFVFGEKKFVRASQAVRKIGKDGAAIMRIKAVVPGADGNITEASTGTISETIAGIDSGVSLFGSRMMGGRDKETCEDFRIRYLERIQYSPNAKLKWIFDKVLEWPGVSSVFNRRDFAACCEMDPETDRPVCPPALELYVLFSDVFPCGIADECTIEELSTWLFGKIQGYGMGQLPFGICGKIYPLKAVYVDVTIGGLACATTAQQNEIDEHIRDYMKDYPPSTNLSYKEIDLIVAQVLGPKANYQVFLKVIPCAEVDQDDKTACDDGCAEVDACENVIVKCDCKICLNDIHFSNLDAMETGCL